MQKIPTIQSVDGPFLDLLKQLQGGRLVRDLSEQYPVVVEAVRKTGKKGKLILELTIKPDGKGEVTTVEVLDEVKTKIPARDRRPTTFFATEENLLSRTDPNQPEFPTVSAALSIQDMRAASGGS